MREQATGSPLQTAAAWGVHLVTASGAVAGFMALPAIAHHHWREAVAWMALTIVLDSVDGFLARACQVKRILPQIDGALLDNIVDYFTYVAVPAYFLYESSMVPGGLGVPFAAAILLASAYQFSQTAAKTEDFFFTGFPSYWNVVVIYLLLLGLPPWLNAVTLGVLVVTVFVPVRYLYPSRTPVLRLLTIVCTLVWIALLVLGMWWYPEGHETPVHASLFYVLYYLTVSIYLQRRYRGAA